MLSIKNIRDFMTFSIDYLGNLITYDYIFRYKQPVTLKRVTGYIHYKYSFTKASNVDEITEKSALKSNDLAPIVLPPIRYT